MSNPSKDLMAVLDKVRSEDCPILVSESIYDTAMRIAKENNIAVKIEPVKAVWKTDEI